LGSHSVHRHRRPALDAGHVSEFRKRLRASQGLFCKSDRQAGAVGRAVCAAVSPGCRYPPPADGCWNWCRAGAWPTGRPGADCRCSRSDCSAGGMDMVTNVTNLSRSGLYDWMAQRVSAVLLAAYTLFLLGYLILNPGLSYEQWQGLFSNNAMRIFSLLAL